MGKVPLSPFDNIPKENIYNMDKLATDTSGHNQKIIGHHRSPWRAFKTTPEGVNRILFHVTICLRSCSTRL